MDIDYRNSKDTWKQIDTIFNLSKRKTQRAEEFYKYFKPQNAWALKQMFREGGLQKIQRKRNRPSRLFISDAICTLKANKAPDR